MEKKEVVDIIDWPTEYNNKNIYDHYKNYYICACVRVCACIMHL